MTPAIYDQTSVNVLSQKKYLFRATGSQIKFSGWLEVGKFLGIGQNSESDNGGSVEGSIMPNVSEGESVDLKSITSEQHFTQPPARYSDATLIKKMEELGVGRPSTYAPTITTIQARGYVEKDGKYFVPKDVAYVVNDLLAEHFPDVVDYGFTAGDGEVLDDIAVEKRGTCYKKFLRTF